MLPRVGGSVAFALALAGAVHAQDVPSETRCYQFDRPYFDQLRHNDGSLPDPDTTTFARELAGFRAARATRRDPSDPYFDYLMDSVRLELTAVVRFESGPADMPNPEALAPVRGPRRIMPVFTLPAIARRDPHGRVVGRRWGYWQPLQADSLEVLWYNGFAGPAFRLAVLGDSLVGTVVHRSDAIKTDSITGRVIRPPALPARAARISCAPPTGPA
jgi:hypothetical protein